MREIKVGEWLLPSLVDQLPWHGQMMENPQERTVLHGVSLYTNVATLVSFQKKSIVSEEAWYL